MPGCGTFRPDFCRAPRPDCLSGFRPDYNMQRPPLTPQTPCPCPPVVGRWNLSEPDWRVGLGKPAAGLGGLACACYGRARGVGGFAGPGTLVLSKPMSRFWELGDSMWDPRKTYGEMVRMWIRGAWGSARHGLQCSTGQSNPLTPTKNTPKRRLASQSGIADSFGLSKKGSILRKICIVPLYGWVFLTRIRSGYQVALEPVVHLAPQNHCYCFL